MKIYTVKEDGIPDMSVLTGRVAFIYDGCIVSGWPLKAVGYADDEWEANSDVGRIGIFTGIEKYIVFDKPVQEL